jgi:glycerol-3-phosphate acyltransferase PlsY
VLYALAIVCGYVAGSLPFGYWLVRAFRGVDIRTVGSGNIGTSNVWRTFGMKLGLPVVILDTLKGFVPAFVFAHTAGYLYGALAGAGAVVGHAFPLFLRFQRGGKMVATAGGVLFALAPEAAGIGLAVWIAVFLLTRYASVASLSVAVVVPVTSYLIGDPWPATVFATVTAVGTVILHLPNVRRLLAGTESRSSIKLRAPRGVRPAA